MLVLNVEWLLHWIWLIFRLIIFQLNDTTGSYIDICYIVKPLTTKHDALRILYSLCSHLHKAPFLPRADSALNLNYSFLAVRLPEWLSLSIGGCRALDLLHSAITWRRYARVYGGASLSGGPSLGTNGTRLCMWGRVYPSSWSGGLRKILSWLINRGLYPTFAGQSWFDRSLWSCLWLLVNHASIAGCCGSTNWFRLLTTAILTRGCGCCRYIFAARATVHSNVDINIYYLYF